MYNMLELLSSKAPPGGGQRQATISARLTTRAGQAAGPPLINRPAQVTNSPGKYWPTCGSAPKMVSTMSRPKANPPAAACERANTLHSSVSATYTSVNTSSRPFSAAQAARSSGPNSSPV